MEIYFFLNFVTVTVRIIKELAFITGWFFKLETLNSEL